MLLNDKVIEADRLARIWSMSRAAAGVSQSYMAKAMRVSKSTIQNWEQGISCPSLVNAIEWFNVLDLQPLPYILQVLFPQCDNIKASDSDERIDAALSAVISGLSADSKRKLLFLLFGDHDSSPKAVLEMVTAHLQTPLRDRLNVASTIITNYELAQAENKVKRPEHIQPNMNLLKVALDRGRQAALEGRSSYIVVTEVEDEKS